MLEEQESFGSYSLLDSGEGYRLERFGDYILSRPDPAVLWRKTLPDSDWKKADAVFLKKGEDRQGEEQGGWKLKREIPKQWLMTFKELSFYAELTPFKHTGVFPEQAANWNFIIKQLQSDKGDSAKRAGTKPLKVLNLFGYTGIASVLCAKLGCDVTHVDASRPSITLAKQNMLASGLPENAIRWILDDCSKFVKREVKRGIKYDAVIMDPPAFGRGAKGEVWKFNEDLPGLLQEVEMLLDKDFKFVIINAYAVSVSSLLLKNMFLDFKGAAKRKIDYGELVLKQESDGKLLSTGIFARLY